MIRVVVVRFETYGIFQLECLNSLSAVLAIDPDFFPPRTNDEVVCLPVESSTDRPLSLSDLKKEIYASAIHSRFFTLLFGERVGLTKKADLHTPVNYTSQPLNPDS